MTLSSIVVEMHEFIAVTHTEEASALGLSADVPGG